MRWSCRRSSIGEPALRELPKIFADSARLSGVIGLIIGFVGAFGWVLTFSKFPFKVAEAIAAIAPDWWLFIILIILLYLLLGTFLTPSEIILVTVPVLLPVAQAAGVHPIHFGMVCVIASAVGHITPPVGLCLFVGMAISGLPMDKLVRPLLPFLAAIVVTLLLVAFIPELTLCRAARPGLRALTQRAREHARGGVSCCASATGCRRRCRAARARSAARPAWRDAER